MDVEWEIPSMLSFPSLWRSIGAIHVNWAKRSPVHVKQTLLGVMDLISSELADVVQYWVAAYRSLDLDQAVLLGRLSLLPLILL
jgi:hypothetical protein